MGRKGAVEVEDWGEGFVGLGLRVGSLVLLGMLWAVRYLIGVVENNVCIRSPFLGVFALKGISVGRGGVPGE